MKKIYQNSLCLAMAGAMALVPSASTLAMTQDESVYVKLDAAGAPYKISVVEHLINDLKENQLFDQSTLEGIENLNGFESFTADGQKINWEAGGNDIYYQGTSQKALPVQLKITYKLNGEEKTLEDMLGKSGQVEIKLKYNNLSKSGALYTPFVAAMATTLDESKVSNVKVVNGKATSNGRTIAVAGVAAPGLYESLGLSELAGTDTVTISFDAKKFELGDIYTIVTPKILESADLKTFAELDGLYAKANQLSTSSAQLVEGTKKLRDGINELRDSVAQLKATMGGVGVNGLADNTAMSQITAKAGQAAAAEMEAKKDIIIKGALQQLQQNTDLVRALQAAGAPVEATLRQLAASSFALAKQTAITTAESTAANVSRTIMATLQTKLGQQLANIPDMLLAALDQLAAGANELNAGMTKFDHDGIQALTNFVNGKVKVTASKMKQLTKLAAEYDNYAGIAPNTEGSTKFIMMVEGRK